jgi:arylsulfatase A-like enzyme
MKQSKALLRMNVENNKLKEVTKVIFCIWSTTLLLFFLPLDFLYHFDSLNTFMNMQDIYIDISSKIIILAIVSAIITIINYVVLNGVRFIFNKNLGSYFILMNKFAGTITIVYLIMKTTKLWLAKVGFASLSMKPVEIQYKLLLIAAVILFVYHYRDKIFTGNSAKVCKCIISVVFIVTIFYSAYSIIVLYKYNDHIDIPSNRPSHDNVNVILITMDALTAEDMSIYGYKLRTTPSIDVFAKKSFIFDNMFANANWTKPGVANIITGSLPSSHGLVSVSLQNVFSQNNKNYNNLPFFLKQYGFINAAIVSNLGYGHPWATDTYRGFDYLPYKTVNWEWVGDRRNSFRLFCLSKYFLGIGTSVHYWLIQSINIYAPWLERSISSYFKTNKWATRTSDPPELVFSMAETYLNQKKTLDKPFFLWLHVTPPHLPYLPSAKFRYEFLPEKGVFDSAKSQRHFFMNHVDGYEQTDEVKVSKLRLRYDENIKYVDYTLGQFLEFLKASKIYDNSIIILTSDHGESFEHGFLLHAGPHLYQSLVHIPLLIHMPGQTEGKRIKSNADQTDIAPTLVDLLGLPIPSYFDGESLRKAMYSDYVSEKPKYLMQLNEDNVKGPIDKGTIAVVKGNYKYIHYLNGSGDKLFDFINDPREVHNLTNSEKFIASDLKWLIVQEVIKKSR